MDAAALCARLALATRAQRQPVVSDHAALPAACARRLGFRDCRGARATPTASASAEGKAVSIPQAFEVARAHHQSGRLAEAEAIYRQILAVEPRHADALHLLGVIAHQVGRN